MKSIAPNISRPKAEIAIIKINTLINVRLANKKLNIEVSLLVINNYDDSLHSKPTKARFDQTCKH